MEPNPLLPYQFTALANKHSFRFTTAQGVVYEAAFSKAGSYFPGFNFAYEALEFSIYDLEESAAPSRFDARTGLTIVKIIADCFRQNPRVVICYVCDQADARAFKRAIRFTRLFEQSNEGQYIEKVDIEQPPLYASILFRHDHPQHDEVSRAVGELAEKLSEE